MQVQTVDRLFPGWAKDTIRILSKLPGEGYIPLALNDMQAAQWAVHRTSPKRRFIVLKARQMGVTTMYLASHLQRCQMLDGYRVGIFALKKEEGAGPISQTLREMLEAQPDQYRQAAPKLLSSSDEAIRWRNGSQIRLFTQAGQETGRSFTFHRLHFTEYGKWENPGTVRAAALPALAPDGELDIESTAGGYNDYYDLAQEVRGDPDSAYEFSFYPWWVQSEYTERAPRDMRLTPEEMALANDHGLTHEQIAFRRLQQKELKALFPQEFAEDPESCFMALGDSAFAYDLMAALRQTCTPAPTVEHDGLLSIWRPPHEGTSYVIGADCAHGVANGDRSAAAILQAGTGRHVATLMDAPPHPASRERRMDPNAFARMLAQTGHRYNTATIAVERNTAGQGQAVIKALLEVHKYPPEHIARFEGAYGFHTNMASKPALKVQFVDALEAGEFSTQDIRLVREMGDFIVQERTGTYEKLGARQGAHDDLVMATMI
ncbi:MAG: hypothetical protein ACRDJE_07310, partial [Dehalococcoidia bacterium]